MNAIRKIVRDVPQHWVGNGFPVRSLFAYDEADLFDPFLLLDYAGPLRFAPAEAPRGVGEHPHRGFETVTIVYQGELEHRDSSGSRGKIGPGDVQWMTAAAGVVHEEFHSSEFTERGGMFEVAQLWVNLPAKEKMTRPRYQGILAREIPQVQLPDAAGTARVIAGELFGSNGPARTFTPVIVCDLRLVAGHAAELPLPDGYTTLVVVQHGAAKLNGGQTARAVALAIFDRAGDGIRVECAEDATALLLCGEPIGEPVVGQGPFVMNSREEIRQSMIDFQCGAMGRLS